MPASPVASSAATTVTTATSGAAITPRQETARPTACWAGIRGVSAVAGIPPTVQAEAAGAGGIDSAAGAGVPVARPRRQHQQQAGVLGGPHLVALGRVEDEQVARPGRDLL